jgi:hypothetical protein
VINISLFWNPTPGIHFSTRPDRILGKISLPTIEYRAPNQVANWGKHEAKHLPLSSEEDKSELKFPELAFKFTWRGN